MAQRSHFSSNVLSAISLLLLVTAQQSDDLLARFAESRATLTSYVGTGSFVRGRYADDPYFSEELALAPRFQLIEHLALRSSLAIECELTEPDRSSFRRCALSDLALGSTYSIGPARAGLAVNLPTSIESRYNHTIVNLRASAGYRAAFFDDRLSIDLNFAVQKYLPSQKVRGQPSTLARKSVLEDGALGSGGRLNDNWALISSAEVSFAIFSELSVSASFALYDYFRFAVPDDALADPDLPARGRADLTAGTIEASYTGLEHFAFSLGVTSAQPALTADNQSPRFPFYDFVSPANNFTRWYLAVHLTY